MTVNAIIPVERSAPETAKELLGAMLERGVVDALLVPWQLPAGDNVAPVLISDPVKLADARIWAPVMPINAARAVSNLTATGNTPKLGAVLRPCEVRALVELTKLEQASLEDTVIVGVDCPGAYTIVDYTQMMREGIDLTDELLSQAADASMAPHGGFRFREGCQICERPLPEGDHVAVTLGLFGLQAGQMLVSAQDDIAEALGLEEAGEPARRKAVVDELVTARTDARNAAFAEFRERVGDVEGLLAEFSTCIRCHNCMINCPICYCKECIFRTATFDHASDLYYRWLDRKGVVRMLPDTTLFHLTRLNHMVTSCVGCGVCTDVCPSDIPVAAIFRTVGQKTQAVFDYTPGLSLEDEIPLTVFREDELTGLGERDSHSWLAGVQHGQPSE
jgi:formate dehydrogenase subunit beta